MTERYHAVAAMGRRKCAIITSALRSFLLLSAWLQLRRSPETTSLQVWAFHTTSTCFRIRQFTQHPLQQQQQRHRFTRRSNVFSNVLAEPQVATPTKKKIGSMDHSAQPQQSNDDKVVTLSPPLASPNHAIVVNGENKTTGAAIATRKSSSTAAAAAGGGPHHFTRQYSFELSKRQLPLVTTTTSRWRQRLFRRRNYTMDKDELPQRLSFRYDSNLLELKCASTPEVTNHEQHSTHHSSWNATATNTHHHPIHPIGADIGHWFYHRLFESWHTTGHNSHDNNIRILHSNQNSTQQSPTATATTGVILIHPVGVGIGKWFYNRLLESLYTQCHNNSNTGSMASNEKKKNVLIVAPDLLGSGSACNPMNTAAGGTDIKKLPLFTVKDWAAQMNRLMVDLETEYPTIDQWCLVANGGCSPIALELAKQSILVQRLQRRKQQHIHPQSPSTRNTTTTRPFESHYFQRPVTNVVLSSVPRLPFFLPPNDNPQSRREKWQKVQKSYRTLCGIPGRLFWWYALREKGSFIQSFSERNLVANATSLGDDWTPNCVATARMYAGKSRYSTFSFLAGSLQAEGCRYSLAALRQRRRDNNSHNNNVTVDILQGRDKRRNQAKSWFWQKALANNKRKKEKKDSSDGAGVPTKAGDHPQDTAAASVQETLQQVLERNGNRCHIQETGGRISLAHEDAPGYAAALLNVLARDE